MKTDWWKPENFKFRPEVLAFAPSAWYDHCKECDTWYVGIHKCTKPVKIHPALWQNLYIKWRQAPSGSLRWNVLLNAWTKELGAVVVKVEPM